MDEVGSVHADDSETLVGENSSRRRKAIRSRPHSASSATTRARKNKPSRPGSAKTVKPRDQSSQQQQQQRRGSRMRGGGDRSSNRNTASSVPLLQQGPVTGIASADGKSGEPTTTVRSTNSLLDEDDDGRLFERRTTRKLTAASVAGGVQALSGNDHQDDDDETRSVVEAPDVGKLLQQLESRNQEVELRRRQLGYRCKQLEAETKSKTAELKSYKAEIRAKTIAVGKAEVTLNEVCLSMARRVGLAEGVKLSDNKGGVLLEVHETPAEFAAQIKKNVLAQLSKWEIDRAALQALVDSAGDNASDAAKAHEAERAELSARAEKLEERIRGMELVSQRQVEDAKAVAEQSRRECEAASLAKDELFSQLETAALRNKELCQDVENNEKEFQAQLDRFMEYPKAAERMAEELDRCQKGARREKNLMLLERKEFRRQLHMFQKWQTENKVLRERIKRQEAQALTLRRQLAVTEAGLAGSASTRKAVIGGTVDRLQRAETAAKHQAHKYRELAGARGVQVTKLEREVSSLKATNKNLQLKLEPPVHDSYETEIAILARVHPEILEVQQKSGLSKEDMQASMAQLKLLREKEEQKDALIALARERDEFELCIKELRARNSWLERQVLRTPEALRSVAQERVLAVAQSEEAELSRRRADSANDGTGGWAGPQGGRGRGEGSRAGPSEGNGPVARLERRLEVQRDAGGPGPGPGGGGAVDLTARIRRNIQFLEDCDWSIEKQQRREAAETNSTGLRTSGAGGGRGVAAAHAARGTATRQRPQSAQGPSRRPSSSSSSCRTGKADTGELGGLFRGGRRPVSAGRA